MAVWTLSITLHGCMGSLNYTTWLYGLSPLHYMAVWALSTLNYMAVWALSHYLAVRDLPITPHMAVRALSIRLTGCEGIANLSFSTAWVCMLSLHYTTRLYGLPPLPYVAVWALYITLHGCIGSLHYTIWQYGFSTLHLVAVWAPSTTRLCGPYQGYTMYGLFLHYTHYLVWAHSTLHYMDSLHITFTTRL